MKKSSRSVRATVLRINTFGLSERARFGLVDRTHKGGPPLDQRTPVELYNALRGTTIAARLACGKRSKRARRDAAIALHQAQVIAIEMARRLLPQDALLEVSEDADDDQPHET